MTPGLSVGLDVVDVRDIEASLARFGARYLARVYTPAEVAYAMSARDRATAARRLAARFAAKEATIKALGAGERGISLRTIEVARRDDGAIVLALSGAAFAAAREAGEPTLAVSVSHEGHLAAAVVICTWVKP